MQILDVLISQIRPYPQNAKKHPADQIKKIVASINEFGFNQPLVIDENNEIIVGHGRYEAAKVIGFDEVPALVISNLSEEQKKAYRLADNKLNESDWDNKLLIEELKGLDIQMIELTGFSTDMILESSEKDDEVPDIREESDVKIGDIYQLGDHRVMCGDSADIDQILFLMNSKKLDMVFTDPPYGVAIGDKNKMLSDFRKGGIQKNIINDNIDIGDLQEILQLAFSNIRSVSNDCCTYFVTAPQNGDLGMMMMLMMREVGLPVRHILIWKKNQATFSVGCLDYNYQHEPIFFTWNKTHKFYGLGEQQTSVWNFDKPSKSKLHPTMKPVELIQNALLNNSKQGDIVGDFFLGSGSTLIACEKTGRICYGMEIDSHYVDVIVKRWEEYTGKKATKIS